MQWVLFWLSVEPDVLLAPAVEDAVDHQPKALDMGAQAGTARWVEDDRAGVVLCQLAFNFPEQLLATLHVCGVRLLLDQLVDFGL